MKLLTWTQREPRLGPPYQLGKVGKTIFAKVEPRVSGTDFWWTVWWGSNTTEGNCVSEQSGVERCEEVLQAHLLQFGHDTGLIPHIVKDIESFEKR